MSKTKDIECGNPAIEVVKKTMELPTLPQPLTLEEKRYLLSVERGDMGNVKRMLQKAHRKKQININCVDSLGRGALTLAIDAENMEMVELLVIMGVDTKDALLQAINAEFVEAVELLLEHEELIHKEGQLYSWQKVDTNTAMFTKDITPLMLAAMKNNYEIIKILLDRGATLPDPHDTRCGCDECIHDSSEDSLRHSLSRLNNYRALASPSLIALSAQDPVQTAFELSWELRNLAFTEQESKSQYLELRRQVQQFAVDLLDQSRSSQELAIILNHDPDEPSCTDGDHMKLAKLDQAIDFKQKKFVAHPNIQQLLAAIWYDGVPGFRRKSPIEKLMIIMRVALLFPFYCTMYMVAPNTNTGKLMRKPFMKFLIHASSYLFFLMILILVSLRAEVKGIQMFGPEWMVKDLEKKLLEQRGNGPTYLEMVVAVYVLGFIFEETQEIYIEGMRSYLRNMWNFIDFSRNSLYVLVAILRVAAYIQQHSEIAKNPKTRFIPREDWEAFDPQLIAEGLFAAANILSALKLVHLFSINPHLGPLQISLGRMVIDIVKFFFIYSLVLFAFACGLNQLLWYFADLEKSKCYVLPGGLPDWENAGDSCMKWRSFGNVFEASQSLFWASFGMVGLENFELAGIKSYTRFWGLLMFGSYSVINVIVLLNLLIAMMSNSYAMIDEHSDVEWKFARTKLWLSYFEEGSTLPPPFNIMPTPKLIMKLLGLRKKDPKIKKVQEEKDKELDVRYTAVMRALVWRYVSTMHRKMEDEPVTEDDVNELKGDVSALRYELLEVFEKNGMDVSFMDKTEKTVLGKRNKVWERRLMKDFQVAPVTLEEEEHPADSGLARFRRIAKMAAAMSAGAKWDETLARTGISTQIGRSRTRQSFKNQQALQKAMEEARKLVMRSPIPGSRGVSPIELPPSPGHNILELIEDIRIDTITPVPGSPVPGPAGLSTIINSTHPQTDSKGFLIPGGPHITPCPTPRAPRARSPNRSRSPSPSPKTADPSPLLAKRVSGDNAPKVIKKKATSSSTSQGEEQTSVASAESQSKSEENGSKLKDDIVVARPIAPEIKPADGALPPPPPYTKNKAPSPPNSDVSPVPSRSKSPTPSNGKPSPSPNPDLTSVKSATSDKPPIPIESSTSDKLSISVKSSTSSKTPASAKLTSASKPPSVTKPTSPLSDKSMASQKSAAAPRPPSPPPAIVPASSTEHLIPSEQLPSATASPLPLRPIHQIEDVKTVKRVPRGGWL